jgi:hypothetical protein
MARPAATTEVLPIVETRPPALREEPRASPFLTLDEAAAYLRVSASYLERSDCPRILLGRRRLFHVEHLERWALAHLSHEIGDAA